MTTESPDGLRLALNGLLRKAERQPVTDAEWSVIVSREYGRHFAEGEPEALGDAFSFLNDARLMRGEDSQEGRTPRDPKPKLDSDEPSAMYWHDRAVSELFAAHAIKVDDKRRFGIVEFRVKVLGGKVLSRGEAGRWVLDQAKREGPPTTITEQTPTGESWRVETLAYGIDDDEWTHHVPVVLGGMLDELRIVSERLVKFYGWTPAQSSFFVLTGAVPWASSFRSTTQWKSPLASRQRIQLNIHPTCTPQEVARFYARVRHDTYGRLRRLSPKHSMLGAFLAAESHDVDPMELLGRWNAKCENEAWANDWKYAEDNNAIFLRDAKAAMWRLAELGRQKGEPFLPPGIKFVRVKGRNKS